LRIDSSLLLDDKSDCCAGGMDVCDKAARLLQCGKENSPEAVVKLMENLENAMVVSTGMDYLCLFYWHYKKLMF
jgi:hypothetical protein